jgi:hypothetical protein
MPSREDRIVEEAAGLLEGSELFGSVQDGTPWTDPVDAGVRSAAWVEWERSDEEDRTRESKLVLARLAVWISVSRASRRDARRAGLRLLAAARQTLSGSALNGLVEPAFTRLVGARAVMELDRQAFTIESSLRVRWIESDGARDLEDRDIAL